MKGTILACSLVILCVAGVSASFPAWKENIEMGENVWRVPVEAHKLGKNGGGSHCVACTLIVHLIESYSTSHNVAIDDFVSNHLCNLFKNDKIRSTCQEIELNWGPTIVQAISDAVDPDTVCQKVKLCTDPTCDLIHDQNMVNTITLSEDFDAYVARATDPNPNALSDSWSWLKDLIGKTFDDHLPLGDVDGDKFSGSLEQLRGGHWRGKDCDDLDAKIYPGRKTNPYTKANDFNCNGISGANPDTGAAYQDELCGANKQMGVAVFGDSAGAHFELPAKWFNASMWDSDIFDGVLGILLDEIDLPYKSTYTGFVESTDDVPVSSIYKKMREADQCNHRDFQNLGVNGGASDDFHNIEAFARDRQNDHPVMIFLELIGNDVCGHHQNFDSMTTPEDFNTNIVKILTYLDTIAPAGSHLVIVGLADGRVLYETLHDRIHPAGMPYPDLYDYLNCMDISPCWGWMNGDSTIRDKTSAIAASLNAEYPKIIADNKFANFDLQYYEFPIREMIDKYVAEGNDPADLIEPVDGFHPGQKANALFADWLWEHLGTDQPTWLPEINANNDAITKLFGDQGGY